MNKTGLIVGAFFGGGHALWSALVAAGLAQRVIDGAFWLHFLNDPFVVESFSLGRAFGLVAYTATVGYVLGWLASAVCARYCGADPARLAR